VLTFTKMQNSWYRNRMAWLN